ncbi:MAG: hypothetical protein M1826_000235 [Phylliscum demangeonii]|nr:MAG: hypothetical protein M1826_000235 [Phylliscum demangeonii]
MASPSIKGPGEATAPTGQDVSLLRIGIIAARWNGAIVRQLVNGVLQELAVQQVPEFFIDVEYVPGSFELPYAAKRLAARDFYDVIIAVGVLIKGDTMHFEYIADAVSQGLMRVQLDATTPVVFGVLTVLNEAQAWDRAGGAPVGPDQLQDSDRVGDGRNHGVDWARAAVELALLDKKERSESRWGARAKDRYLEK